MLGQLAAFAVHAFTAVGVVLGFQALIAAAAHRWEEAFAWLGAALVVDGLDGPLARRVGVKSKLPRFSGERLDLIIDYLTYVMVPAYIIYEAGLMPPQLSMIAVTLILMSSLYHFIDNDSKTDDGFFVGFPAIWNIVALYLFIFTVPASLAFAVIFALTLLTFLPSKWVHPVRVKLLRPITIAVMVLWTAATVFALVEGFPGSLPVQLIIALSSFYIVAVGIKRSIEASEEAARLD
jgi:phosphatidylcholine synthase